MKLYLVRHTRVDVPPGICYGQSDVPLANTFEEESLTVAQQLKGIPFTHTFSSPLKRCICLAKKISTEMIEDERLKELNFGEWEGRPWDEIFETKPGRKWFADYLNEACPNGESYNDILGRVRQFIHDLPDTDGNVLIVTHAGIVRAFLVLLKNQPVKKAFDKPVAYGQITIIEKRRI